MYYVLLMQAIQRNQNLKKKIKESIQDMFLLNRTEIYLIGYKFRNSFAQLRRLLIQNHLQHISRHLLSYYEKL